jgi:hypothetical protein
MQLTHKLYNGDVLTIDVDTTEAIEDFIRYCNDLNSYLKSVFPEPAAEPADKPATQQQGSSHRDEPATAKQIESLKRNHIAFKDGITKGEAYDILNGIFGGSR